MLILSVKTNNRQLFKHVCFFPDHCTDLQHVMSEPGPESNTEANPECQALNIPSQQDLDLTRVSFRKSFK